ncbi:nucleotidyltransferase family protein [Inhella gelatinilytica]|uniref:Nucleotidyltransferase family protein n=1 Tax=Inhella gelatinilytica TaxID=2795030 RepID=A0A931IWS7_9BURK|nr:nucleotidyltransferase family protein [Inhella gelatinilytica]MBH9553001.1 nucleotidyltransferase family protein [Inhella gelatinilytica]
MNAGLPVVIVLAAGPGARFSGPGHKLEQTIGDRTVLECTVGVALASGMRTVVVCREGLAPKVRRWVAARDMVVVPGTADGLGQSIAAGVNATATAPGWILLPGDMPLVRTATLRALSAQLMHAPVVVAQHRGRRGYPVGFGAELVSELVSLHGNEGPKRLIARFSAVPVEVNDPGVLFDVDTVEDLEALRQRVSEVDISGFGELSSPR